MTFENLIELNSTIADGFLLNDIINLLRKDYQALDDGKKERILKNAKNYLNLVQNGKKFITEEIPVNNLTKSIGAYNTVIKAFRPSKNIDQINDIIGESLDQIEKSLTSKIVKKEGVNAALDLFSLIRNELIKKANRISDSEEFLHTIY